MPLEAIVQDCRAFVIGTPPFHRSRVDVDHPIVWHADSLKESPFCHAILMRGIWRYDFDGEQQPARWSPFGAKAGLLLGRDDKHIGLKRRFWLEFHVEWRDL